MLSLLIVRCSSYFGRHISNSGKAAPRIPRNDDKPNANPILQAFQRRSQGEKQTPRPESVDVFGCSIGSTQEYPPKQSQRAAMKISGLGCEESVSAESAPWKSPALRVGAQMLVADYCRRKENVGNVALRLVMAGNRHHVASNKK